MNIINHYGLFTAVSAILAMNSLLPQAIAQPITVPQSAPYTNDAYTVLLQHFDGTTTGTKNGTVIYTNGVFGQGVHLNAGSWVSWNLGALSQGTVELWVKLDDTRNESFIMSGYSQFYASTFVISIATNIPGSCVNSAVYDWFGTPSLSSPIIKSNTWHHYATTWGSQGFKWYVDGSLVNSNPTTSGQNGNTSWWCIGGQTVDGPGWGAANFSGTIDEVRISNIQRQFVPAPALSISIAAFNLNWFAYANTNYQVQWSTNLQTWNALTNIIGAGFNTNVVDWVNGPKRFYRLTVQ
jgi:hypothetical protein